VILAPEDPQDEDVNRPHLVWRTTQQLQGWLMNLFLFFLFFLFFFFLLVRDLHAEVRCRRDLSFLLDPEKSSIICVGHTVSVNNATALLVEDLFERSLIEEEAYAGVVDAIGTDSEMNLSAKNDVFSVSLVAVPRMKERFISLAVARNGYLRGCVITSEEESGTKNARELGLTLASFLAIPDVQRNLLNCETPAQIRAVIRDWLGTPVLREAHDVPLHEVKIRKVPLTGIWNDLKQRVPFYLSDFVDGFVGPKHLQKTISATFFLYFAILLPSLALGQEYSVVTEGVFFFSFSFFSFFLFFLLDDQDPACSVDANVRRSDFCLFWRSASACDHDHCAHGVVGQSCLGYLSSAKSAFSSALCLDWHLGGNLHDGVGHI
jgi:hypothetical protein